MLRLQLKKYQPPLQLNQQVPQEGNIILIIITIMIMMTSITKSMMTQ